MPDTLFAANTRLFVQEGGANPQTPPEYVGRGRAGAVDFGQGSLTPVRQPSAKQYGAFDTVAIQRGAPDLPSITIEERLSTQISRFLRLINSGCPIDIQVHLGQCENPEDFVEGWTWARVIENAQASAFSTSDMGAFDEGQDAPIVETTNWSGDAIYDIAQIRATEQAGDEVTDEVVGIVVADSISCGNCGAPSDGCSVVLAVQKGTTGSPGLPIEVVFTIDGGNTWAQTNVGSATVGDTAADIEVQGSYVIVTTPTSTSYHIALLADVLAGTDVWTEITEGIDVSGAPTQITVASATNAWMCGVGGRIYYTPDPTGGVVEQADGSQTTEDLLDIHAFDTDQVLSVGASNAVLLTRNGGATWSLLTGPAVGIDLNTCFMHTADEWFVGTADGRLYFTRDAGAIWVEKVFPGSGGGQVRKVRFATSAVGYMAHDTAAPSGRILRTIDGGRSWYVLPEEQGTTIPANDRITDLATCGYDQPNAVYGGGAATGATDGIIVKFS